MTQPVLCHCLVLVQLGPKNKPEDFFTETHCPLLSNILHAWPPALILILIYVQRKLRCRVDDELSSGNFCLSLGTYASCLKPIIWTIYKQKWIQFQGLIIDM